jgi:hypothetical protein
MKSDWWLAKAVLPPHSNPNGMLPPLGHHTLSRRNHIWRLHMKSVNRIFVAATKCRTFLFLLPSLPRSAWDNELVILIESTYPAELESLFGGENEALKSGLSAFKLTLIHFPSRQKYALKRSPENGNGGET